MNAPAENGNHYHIEAVGPGLYAAIHRPGGWGVGNAGIVDLGDATLVFDTGMTAAAVAGLRQAADRLTGKPVSTATITTIMSGVIRLSPPEPPFLPARRRADCS